MDDSAAAAPADGNAPPAPRADAQGGMQDVVIPSRRQPARPQPDAKTQAFAKKWLDRTEDVPEFDSAVKTAKICQRTLFPGWWDPTDPWKGRKSRDEKTGEDDRRVNTPLAYLNIIQTVAMTCPQEHRAKWLPGEEVPAEDGSASPMAKFLRRFGRSIEIIAGKYLAEIGVQDILEAHVRDSATFPMAVIKAFFSREMASDPTHEGGEHDEQDNAARVREIGEDLARGDVTQTDPRLIELRNLLEGMGGKSEVELWEGMVVENIQMTRFRVAPEVTSLETVYSAPWMSNDVDYTVSEIRQKFPFVDNGDGTWTGVHPDDLQEATSNDRSTANRKGGRVKPRPDVASTTMRGAAPDDASDKRKLTVREVWAKCDNKVYVFIAGVPYAIHQWTPTRGPEQWYPYILLVPNPLFGTPYGVSDVELQADEQARVNRKKSDGEKARYNDLPRHFYNSAMMDEKEAKQLTNPPPYSWTPIRLGAEGFAKHVFTIEGKTDPAAFDTSANGRDLQRAAMLPEQATGVTGSAQFAEEVKVAAQGSSIAARFRQNRITRSFERFYDVVAQILLQEVAHDQAVTLGGEHVVWPKVYSDQDGKRQHEAMKQEIRQQLMQQVMSEAPVDPITGMPQLPPMDQIRPQLEARMQQMLAAKCIEVFGFPEPMTREALYRRLRVKVSVALDGQIDRQSRMQGVLEIFSALAQASQAAQLSGLRLNLLPFLRQLVTIVGADEDLYEEMFGTDAGQAASQLVEALQSGQQIDPAAAQQVMLAMQQAIAPMVAAPPPPGQPSGAPAAGQSAAPAANAPGPSGVAQPAPGMSTAAPMIG